MALSQADILRRRIDRLTEELVRIESLPIDDFEDGSVISFEKTFGNTKGDAYTYAAVKAKGRWWLSGHRGAGGSLTWEDLLTFIYDREQDEPIISYVTEWSEL